MSGRVAVIAVHGVADQLPFASARATADLLKCQRHNKVTGFDEEQLRLEVLPLGALKETGPEQSMTPRQPEPGQNSRQGRDALLATRWEVGAKLDCDTPKTPAVDASAEKSQKQLTASGDPVGKPNRDQTDRAEILKLSRKASDQYFAEQLSQYHQQPADAVYETVCLSATIDKMTIGEKKVDVYEMYWADLSRVQSGIFRAVEELYYVLFSVCYIGRMELDRSEPLFSRTWLTRWLWWCLRLSESIAERILTLFVPLGNACLFLLVVFALPHLLSDCTKVGQWTFLVPLGMGTGFLVGVIVFLLRFIRQPKKHAFCYSLSGLVWGVLWKVVVGGLCGFGISFLHLQTIHTILAELLWLACGAALVGLGWACNKRQPGMLWVSVLLGLTLLDVVAGEAFLRPRLDKYWALDVGLAAAEWTLAGLVLMWSVYFLAVVACSLLGWLVVCLEWKSPVRQQTAKRVVWTANLAILVPGMLSIVLNLGIWQALYLGGGYLVPTLFPEAFRHEPICVYACPFQELAAIEDHVSSSKAPCPCATAPIIECASLIECASRTTRFSIEAVRIPALLIHNAALPMIVVLVALVLMLLSAGCLLLPAILAEGDTDSDPPHHHARQLGNSLSFAWKGMRWCAELLVRGQAFVMVFVLYLLLRHTYPPWLPFSHSQFKCGLFVLSGPALGAMGTLFVALATGVLQYAGLRTVVDVAADVGNWMRLHPKDNNPTSRISARYVSLLRHVAQWKDKDGEPYERVVIFAHSLGSAITVDLLQFLQKHPDAGLDRINDRRLPVHLFTHGCPLRQLLGLRLPITYGWAWHGSEGWNHNEEPVGQELLGVEKWVNTYCSGDYVGRYLWHDDISEIPWDDVRRTKAATVPRVEWCVGAGAHVHYWDPDPQSAVAGAAASSAPSTKVAHELLKLIGVALPE